MLIYQRVDFIYFILVYLQEVLPQLPGMMISKVAAPPSSPPKLERKAPCIPGRNCETPWDHMGQHHNCLESMVETCRNLNRMVLCQNCVFFKSSIARQFLGFMIHLKFSGVAMPKNKLGSSFQVQLEKHRLFLPYSKNNGRSGKSYTHREPCI